MTLTPARSGLARSGATRSGYPVLQGKVLPRYALSNIARSGASRARHHSPNVFVAINGVQYGTGRVGQAGALVNSLSIADQLNETPNTATCTTAGFIPVEGQEVIVTLGSRNNASREFAGTILSTREFYISTPRNYQHALNLIDYTWGLNKRKVRARYTTTTVATIATSLLATYGTGYTLVLDADIGAAAIDEITFTDQDLTACLSQLVKRVGGSWRCDYDRRVRLFFGDTEGTPPTLVNATHLSLTAFEQTRDLSQVITRVYVEGGGSAAITDVKVGETILPVETGEWYEAGGGVVVSGPQRIAYAARTLGGGGGLVGPGAAPSGAPVLELANGVGVTSGPHLYAVTFQTAAGQSLPSPLTAITVGAVPSPTTAPVPGAPAVGSGPDPGSHDYAVTFVTAAGETTPGPRVTQQTGLTAPPATAPTPGAPISGAGVTFGAHDYAVTWVTAVGETTPSPISGSVTTGPLAGPTQTPSMVVAADGTGYGPGGWHIGDTIELVYTYSSTTTSLVVSAPSPPTSLVLVEEAQFPGTVRGITAKVFLPTNGVVQYVTVWVRNVTTGSAFLLKYGFTPTAYTGGPYAFPLLQSGWGPDALPAPNDVLARVPLTIPRALKDLGNGLFGFDGTITNRKLYRRSAGAGLRLVTSIAGNSTTAYTDTTPNASLGVAPPTISTAYLQRILLSALPIGIALVTARKIYRTAAGGTQLKFLTTNADNVSLNFLDTIPDASLGANAPTTNTAMANRVQLSGIPFGAAAVTQRILYRTAAGGAQLKQLAVIPDNTSTSTYLDSNADGVLGANVPVSDTSALAQPVSTLVVAGSTSLLVANISAFSAGGGWAIIGNGDQIIRYTGITASSLTGIPSSGPGAIVASITWNSTVTAAPALTGIPASGAGAVQIAIIQGDEVNLFVQVDDLIARAALAALLGGDGVQEDVLQDRRLSQREALARGFAHLEAKKHVVVELRYQTRDLNARTGRLQAVNLGPPFSLLGDFLVQSVTEQPFNPHLMPRFDITASNARFTFDEFLRLIHDEVT